MKKFIFEKFYKIDTKEFFIWDKLEVFSEVPLLPVMVFDVEFKSCPPSIK